jgi:hypothetical protein
MSEFNQKSKFELLKDPDDTKEVQLRKYKQAIHKATNNLKLQGYDGVIIKFTNFTEAVIFDNNGFVFV